MIVKQAELRSNIKKYFDLAYDGETVLVPRKDNKNVIILSETEYNTLIKNRPQNHLLAYNSSINSVIASGTLQAAASSGLSTPHIRSYLDTTDIKSDNLDRLAVFSEFKYGWNGNDAEPFSAELICKVQNILNKINIQPEIFPSAAGTIDFEFTNSRKDFMSIDIGTADTAEVFIVLYNGQELSEYINCDYTTINERIKYFYG